MNGECRWRRERGKGGLLMGIRKDLVKKRGSFEGEAEEMMRGE